MRRPAVRDFVLLLAALAGAHALCVWMPSRLVRSDPAPSLLPLTAPDCATLLRDAARPSLRGVGRGAGENVPASPVRP